MSLAAELQCSGGTVAVLQRGMRLPSTPSSVVVSVVAVVSLVGSGCGSPLVVSDRSDVGRSDETVRVYSAGAAVSFFVDSSSPFVDAGDLVVTSSDEAVFTVQDGLGEVVQIATVAEGTAELVFRQNGDVVDSRRIVVRNPARITLELEVVAEKDSDLLPAPVQAPDPLLVLRGRETRLVVHAFDVDDDELFGSAVTSAAVVGSDGWTTAVEAEGPHSALRLSPGADATAATLRLQVGGAVLRVDLPCEPREIADIERIVLDEGGSEGGRSVWQRSLIMARAEDAAGVTLLGNPGWQLEGEDAGIGFAIEYVIGLGVPAQEIVARLGPVEARRTIYPEAGSVAAIDGGCASTPVSGLPLAALGLLLRRRRRFTR